MDRLKGKIALITGAASGFGAEMAHLFAKEGAKIVLADLSGAGAKEKAAEIGKDTAIAVQADVSKTKDVENMVNTALDNFEGLDILVNNAGYTHSNQPMLNVTEEEFDRVYAVNVKAIFLAALAVVPHFRSKGSGVIINIASTAGLRPRPGLTWYNSSKGAAITMTKSMAVELASNNIRVNALCPVMSETGLLERFMGCPDTPENRKKFVSTIPLGRMGKPRDIANAALFLASDEAEFLTGLAMEVDGGRCI